MSIILALDGNNNTFSVAIHNNGEKQQYSESEKTYSQIALPLIHQALIQQGLTLNDIDIFAFASGPGRFSNLRFICALAKTFAYALNKPLISVPTFVGIAQATFPINKPTPVKAIKCALPGNREYALLGLCERQTTHWVLRKKQTVSIHSQNPPFSKTGVACGEGFSLYPHLLAGACYYPSPLNSNATAIAEVAQAMYHTGELTAPFDCNPLYVRHKVAQTIKERLKSKLAASIHVRS